MRRYSALEPVAPSTSLRAFTIWLLLAGSVGVLVLWPLGELFLLAGDELGRRGSESLSSPATRQAILNSTLIALAVASFSVSLGTIAGFVTERSGRANRRWLRLGIVASLFIPPFVSALSWTRAFGPSGLTDDLLGLTLPGLFGPGGIALVIGTGAMPISYLIVVAALNSGVNRERERAARISGAGSLRAVIDVTIPLLGSALVGAGLISFVIALNSFGVPAVLGSPARFQTVTTLIYQELARSARPESFTKAILLACLLAAAAVVLAGIAETLLGRHNPEPRSSQASGPITVAAGGRWLAGGMWAFVTIATALPLLALVLVSVTRGVGLAPVPANWTLSNFGEATTGRFLGALGRSLLLATLAAIIATILGALASLQRRRQRLVGSLVLWAFAVPGSTLAVAVLLAYGRALRDTLLMILIAYLAKLWAVSHRSIRGSVQGLAPDLLSAARSSGASGWQSTRTVLLPLLRPALVVSLLVVFLFAFHELTMSSLLYGPGTDTLAVAILNLQQIGDVPVSSALAVILTLPLLLIAIPIVILGRANRTSIGSG